MSDKRSFSDAFAPRNAQGKTGFGQPKPPSSQSVARPPQADAFKPPAKPVKAAKPANAKPPKDAFAPGTKADTPRPRLAVAKPVKVKAEPKLHRPPPPPKVVAPKPEVALKPVPQSTTKARPLARAPEQKTVKVEALVPQPAAARQPALVRAEAAPKTRQPALAPASAPRKSAALTPAQKTVAKPAMTRPAMRRDGKAPKMALAAAGATLAKPPSGSGFYNPFDRKRFVQSPAPAVDETIAAPDSAPAKPDPFFDLPPETPPPLPEPVAPPEPRRAPLHVVPSAPQVDAVAKPAAAKPGAAARSSSLVLVSGGGAVSAAETADAEAPPAEKPPEPAPAAPAPAATAAEPAPPPVTAPPKRGGGGGGGEPPRGPVRRARAIAHRGFNQDDLFGVIFGLAVIAFLLMWFMRGKGDDALEDGTLFAAQSAPAQRLAVSPTPSVPAPLPPADPFGQGPVDLKPQGPIPEATPAPPEVVEAAPTLPAVAAAPPPVIAESALPLAERKMHAWFCTASSRLTKASRTELNSELDKFAQVFAGKELVVRGYADTRGSTEYNSALSGNRASVVADFLRTKGLTVTDFTGVGELEGLDDNQNCANQRRVDVWVKGGPAETPSRACAPEPDVESLVCG